MATKGTSYQEIFDFQGMGVALSDLEKAYIKYNTTVLKENERLKKDQLEITQQYKDLKAIIAAVPTGKLTTLAVEAQKLKEKSDTAKKAAADLNQTLNVSAASVEELKARQAALTAEYNKQNPAIEADRKRMAELKAEMALTSGQANILTQDFAKARREITVGANTYRALQKETTALKNSLKNLPDAFDKNTGAINRQNKEAVALQAQIEKNAKSLLAFDRQLGDSQRNVGFYPKNTEGIIGSLAKMAAGFATVDVAIQAVSAVTNATAEFEKYEAVLTNTLGSQQAATEALDLIQRVAAKTPNSVNEMTESFVKLANRGFVPTEQELLKLADLAASTGKPFDQLTEAILDAQTGEFERLKEFGIGASKAGDQITFSFKGQTTTVKATGDQIQKYILTLGDLKGVAGSTAGISKTLGGQLSNLGDQATLLLTRIGRALSPLASLILGVTTTYLQALNFLFKSADDKVKDSLSAFEDQKSSVASLNKEIAPLLTRYDQLSEKARQAGGETKLSRGEQLELKNAIAKVSEVIPSAISAQNEYGKAMSINTTLARNYITEQERVSQVLNADSINKYNQSLSVTKQRMQNLQQQLILVQGATPTAGGGPAVSTPTNSGQSTGFLSNLSESQRVSQIAQITRDLAKSNEEAKSLQATIDYLSGKAPKPKSNIPLSTPSTTIVGAGAGKAKKELTDLQNLEKQIADIKAQIQSDILEDLKAGRDASVPPKLTQLLNNLEAQVKAVNDTIKKVEEGYYSITATDFAAGKRVIDLSSANTLDPKSELTSGLTDKKGRNLTGSETDSVEAKRTKQLETELDRRINLLNAYGLERADIEKQFDTVLRGVSEESKNNLLSILDEERAAREKNDKAELDSILKRKDAAMKAIDAEADARKRLRDVIQEIGTTVVNGAFDNARAESDARLTELDKQKERELTLAGDNAAAKKAINDRYDKQVTEIRRKQSRADKLQALFSIAINTSSAILKNTAELGFLAAIPVNIATAALGLIQAGFVASKAPAYKLGKKATDPYTGPALAGEAGTELKVDKAGNTQLIDKPTWIQTKAGDTIFTAAETKRILSAGPSPLQRSLITSALQRPHVSGIAYKGPTAAQIGAETAKAIKDTVPVHEHISDERGTRRAVRQANQRIESLNSWHSL